MLRLISFSFIVAFIWAGQAVAGSSDSYTCSQKRKTRGDIILSTTAAINPDFMDLRLSRNAQTLTLTQAVTPASGARYFKVIQWDLVRNIISQGVSASVTGVARGRVPCFRFSAETVPWANHAQILQVSFNFSLVAIELEAEGFAKFTSVQRRAISVARARLIRIGSIDYVSSYEIDAETHSVLYVFDYLSGSPLFLVASGVPDEWTTVWLWNTKTGVISQTQGGRRVTYRKSVPSQEAAFLEIVEKLHGIAQDGVSALATETWAVTPYVILAFRTIAELIGDDTPLTPGDNFSSIAAVIEP